MEKVTFVSLPIFMSSHVQKHSVTLAVPPGISSEIPLKRTNISGIHAELRPRISSEIHPTILPEITLPALQTILSKIHLKITTTNTTEIYSVSFGDQFKLTSCFSEISEKSFLECFRNSSMGFFIFFLFFRNSLTDSSRGFFLRIHLENNPWVPVKIILYFFRIFF